MSGRGERICFALVVAVIALRRGAYAEGVATNGVPSTVHALTAPGIDNFYQLSDRFYSGAMPVGDEGFASLQKLGIKTIITVDGMKPDVEAAERFNLRYVHLPIGYDGVPPEQALRLVKAAETVPGPIFIHCHHGMHRGPAGAAVICMAVEGWTPDQAEAWLHVAGTSTNYPGLYRSVEHFRTPSAGVLKKVPGSFPEITPPSPLVTTMVRMDGLVGNLKATRDFDYQPPPGHRELEPGPQSLLLEECLKELLRSPTVENRPADFMSRLTDAEHAAVAVHESISNGASRSATDATLQNLNKACEACHKTYRN